MKKYTIKAHGSTSGLTNPLRRLDGEEYDSREEACEAIYAALYDIISSGWHGCEMVEMPVGEMTNAKLSKYIDKCHDYILREGWASEDGWTASVEEV